MQWQIVHNFRLSQLTASFMAAPDLIRQLLAPLVPFNSQQLPEIELVSS